MDLAGLSILAGAVQTGYAFAQKIARMAVANTVTEAKIQRDLTRVYQIVCKYQELWMYARANDGVTLGKLRDLDNLLCRAISAGSGLLGRHVATILGDDDGTNATIADLALAIRKADIPGLTRKQAARDRRFFVRSFELLVQSLVEYIDEVTPCKALAKKIGEKSNALFSDKAVLKARLQAMLVKAKKNSGKVAAEEKQAATAAASSGRAQVHSSEGGDLPSDSGEDMSSDLDNEEEAEDGSAAAASGGPTVGAKK